MMISKTRFRIPRISFCLVAFVLPLAWVIAPGSAEADSSVGDKYTLPTSANPAAEVSIEPSPTPVRVPLAGLGARVAVELLAPIEPVAALGRKHLFYELRLTNFDPRDLLLSRIEVIGPENSRIAEYSGKELEDMVATNPWGSRTPYILARGAQSVVFFTIPLEPGKAAPEWIRHRLEFQGETGTGPGVLKLDTHEFTVAQKKPAVFMPPVRGSFWYAHSGPANKTHHRRTLAPREGMLTMDQRFGIDLFLINQRSGNDGKTYYVPDWQRTLDADVYSVAPGEIVKVVGGIPEEEFDTKTDAGIPVNWDTIGGNLVVLKIAEGQFVWYEHLKAGSIVVKVGDKVGAGEKLGVIGTSGNAGGAPHMHFEFTDSMVLGIGNGIPYVFPCFEMPFILDDFPDWDRLIQNDPLNLGMESGTLRKVEVRQRRMEIPLAGSIMSFSEPGKCGE